MKKLLLLALLVSVSFFANAKVVLPEEALVFATKFMELVHGKALNGEVLEVFQADNNEPLTYVVNFEPEGWIILSADDRVQSVIAFSAEGNFNISGVRSVPFYFWFDGYANDIKMAKKSKADKIHPSWDLKYFNSSKTVTIDPLIKVTWNQNAGWNSYCPADANGPGGHTYAGCVAVAMAQCMSVYKHPFKGENEHQYNDPTYGNQYVNFAQQEYFWDSMPTSTPNAHVAKLLYHLGVSVNMSYGADGSGAHSSAVPGALKIYFKYSGKAKLESKSNYSDDQQWKDLLINELMAGRPVYYSGDGNDGQAGHAFCLDGVNQNGLFHFNWGWTGSYDGYYSIGSLTPGNNNFSYNQQAVIGFEPRNEAPYDIELSNTTVYEKKPAGTFVAKVTVMDETPNDIHTFDVRGPVGIDETPITVPFIISNDSLVTTQELNRNVMPEWEIIIKATDISGLSIEKSFFISVLSQPPNTSVETDGFAGKVSAYLQHGLLIVEIDNSTPGMVNMEMIDISGKILKRFAFNKGTETFYTSVSLSGLKQGLYLLRVEQNGYKAIKKVMVW
ncbi:MAG TPA: hypothetical protein DDY04_03530 [Bacteroidales bacterium]|nr:hypothetical protein [Bacteroidales bacterium]